MNRRIVATIIMIFVLVVAMAAKKSFTLVIDPGHGGHDAGAIGTFSKEKNINLNVALAFGRLVENNCSNVKVIYTRKTDVFIPLHQRADIANRNKADLFISIHTNALPKGAKATGLETYTLGMHRASDNFDVAKRENSVILIEKDYKQHYEGFDPSSSESYIMFEFLQDKNMAQSVELAKMVQKRTCAAATRPNKGVKQAGFLVLRETSMPSCLIELGFISTPSEEQFLNSDEGIANMGRGIYQAFCDYLSKYDKSFTVPFKPEISRQELDERPQPAVEETKEDTKEERKAAPAEKPANQEEKQKVNQDEAPVFKVQILTSSVKLKSGSRQLKGQEDADFYKDGNIYKYTVGSSTNYNEIYRLRKQLLSKFPEAFIIAFKNGQRMDVQQAIREFKKLKN
ncbi:MAG: N-acetylmuramoyl-L-alanine amidase [Prevotella sp.]|nr:N-acetylmuramoyl-L-alanine amidase [Prevotella sp.]